MNHTNNSTSETISLDDILKVLEEFDKINSGPKSRLEKHFEEHPETIILLNPLMKEKMELEMGCGGAEIPMFYGRIVVWDSSVTVDEYILSPPL